MTESTMHMTTTPKPGTVPAESGAALSSVVQAELAELRKHNPDLDEAEAFAELCKRRPDLDEALNAPPGFEPTGKVDDPDEAMRQELAELRKWNPHVTEEEAFASLCKKRPDLDERLNGPGLVHHE